MRPLALAPIVLLAACPTAQADSELEGDPAMRKTGAIWSGGAPHDTDSVRVPEDFLTVTDTLDVVFTESSV